MHRRQAHIGLRCLFALRIGTWIYKIYAERRHNALADPICQYHGTNRHRPGLGLVAWGIFYFFRSSFFIALVRNAVLVRCSGSDSKAPRLARIGICSHAKQWNSAHFVWHSTFAFWLQFVHVSAVCLHFPGLWGNLNYTWWSPNHLKFFAPPENVNSLHGNVHTFSHASCVWHVSERGA